MDIDQFLQYLSYERNLSHLTVKAYGDDLKQLVGFLTRGKEEFDAKSVTQADLRAWMVDLSRQGDSPRSIRRKIQAVRAYYKWLLKRGVVEVSPAADLELAKVPKRLPQYVREASINAILDEPLADDADFETVRNRLMVMMLYETGIRRAELISLLDRNVDTSQRQMKVHGKRDKDRIVPFGEELKEAIEHYRMLRGEIVADGTGELFVTARGGRLYPSLVYGVIRDSLSEAGVSGKKSPHVLRHSFASAMLNDGAELNSVKELLGHESLAATQVYTHITFSELKNNYKHAHPRALKKGG